MNILDLFSGIGGFHLGLLRAGIKPNFSFFSEIDKNAASVYQQHFTNSINLGDVRSIEPVQGRINNQKISLVTFGFPCQDLSIAGKGRGFRGDRSSLFFEAIRLIEELQPEIFVFENVKGFFASNGGQDFAIALRTIANAGYDGQWQLVNSRWFLPHNRERIYFVGHSRKRCVRGVFPIEEAKRIHNTESERKKEEVIPCLTTRGSKSRLSPDAGFVTSPRRFENKKQDGTTQDWHEVFIDNDVRELTPLEGERLQGFPDNWTKGHSNAQRYKMLGNAVTVPVVQAIFEKIKEVLK